MFDEVVHEMSNCKHQMYGQIIPLETLQPHIWKEIECANIFIVNQTLNMCLSPEAAGTPQRKRSLGASCHLKLERLEQVC